MIENAELGDIVRQTIAASTDQTIYLSTDSNAVVVSQSYGEPPVEYLTTIRRTNRPSSVWAIKEMDWTVDGLLDILPTEHYPDTVLRLHRTVFTIIHELGYNEMMNATTGERGSVILTKSDDLTECYLVQYSILRPRVPENV